MVIGDGRVGNILKSYLNNVQKTSSKVRLPKDKEIKENRIEDKVTFSPEAKEFQKLLEELKDIPEVREDKVAEYKKLIEAGKYNVNTEDIVDSIIRFFSGEEEMTFDEVKERLYEILNKEYHIYTELLEIFEKEKRAIMEDDLELLNSLILEGEEKTYKIKSLEDERKALLGKEFPIKKIDSLIDNLKDDEEREKFKSLKDGLLSTIEELRHLKETNELIIEKTLKYLRFYIDLLSKEIGSFVYGKRGILGFDKDILNKFDERV